MKLVTDYYFNTLPFFQSEVRMLKNVLNVLSIQMLFLILHDIRRSSEI